MPTLPRVTATTRRGARARTGARVATATMTALAASLALHASHLEEGSAPGAAQGLVTARARGGSSTARGAAASRVARMGATRGRRGKVRTVSHL